MEKNGTPASPATARASRVLPVPGAPMRRTPLGMRAPIWMNFFGFLRKSTISASSVFASFAPATSAKVTFCAPSSGWMSRAIERPKEKACMPPPRNWRERYQMTPRSRSAGTSIGTSVRNQKRAPPSSATVIFTAFSLSEGILYLESVSVSELSVSLRENFSVFSAPSCAGTYVAVTLSPLTSSEAMLPAVMSAAICDMGTVSVSPAMYSLTSEYPAERSMNAANAMASCVHRPGPSGAFGAFFCLSLRAAILR